MRDKIWNEYRNKLQMAEESVRAVKSGDNVYYSHFAMFPKNLDAALAKRAGELKDVRVTTVSGMVPAQVALCDPEHKSFTYYSSFFSNAERQLAKKGLCFFVPSNYSESVKKMKLGFLPKPHVVIIKTAPMDEYGYFNFGPAASYVRASVDRSDQVIVEVDEGVPRCLGGFNEQIHISEVHSIVEVEQSPLPTIPKIEATEEEQKIASYIMEEIHDGCCLQLGIGGIPNMVGKMIAQSEIKDLGVHSEMMCDAFMDLYLRGKVNGKYKYTDKTKMIYTFALGSAELYRFLHNNPACAIYSVDYTNTPEYIARNENMISINNCLQVDLWGQVASEAQGIKQISGSGGQADFVQGAIKSPGGKSFLCMRSTRMLGDKRISRIVPDITGITSVTRATTNYIVTEQGKFNVKGKSTWEIAEGLISIAHPDFRDELIRAAQEKGIWRRSNKVS